LFKVNTDGTGFSTLHSFTAMSIDSSGNYYTNSDGAAPQAGLILSGNTLYGTALGGPSASGTVFALNTDGTGFTTIHSFTSAFSGSYPYPNSDGAEPYAGLILSGNTLYGTAVGGGSSGSGTVFALNTDGTGFKNLYNLTSGSDGANLRAGLILSGNTLYGTAVAGGSSGSGTLFKVNTDGTDFSTLHSFTSAFSGSYPYPNSDGAEPSAGLTLSGNTLYGTASWGGTNGTGTVFAVNTDGTGFRNLYSFTATSGPYPGPYTNSDGANPYAGLILSGNTLYGTTANGGSSGNGTVFSLSFPPQLKLTPSGPYLILMWPTNYAGFDYTGYTLQSTTNLGPSAVWTTNSPPPIIVNGQNTVTNPITGT
jgi:uncharacterized repeat protein (TIGR03803 family)